MDKQSPSKGSKSISLCQHKAVTWNSFFLDVNSLLRFGDSQERAIAPHNQENKLFMLENLSPEQQGALKGWDVGRSTHAGLWTESEQCLSFDFYAGAASALWNELYTRGTECLVLPNSYLCEAKRRLEHIRRGIFLPLCPMTELPGSWISLKHGKHWFWFWSCILFCAACLKRLGSTR